MTFQVIGDKKRSKSHKVTNNKSQAYHKLVQGRVFAVKQLTVHTGSVIVKSKDRIELLWKLHQGINQVEIKEMEAAVEVLITRWNDHYNSSPPGSTDNNKHLYHIEQAIKTYAKYNVCVFHLAFWLLGQQYKVGPVISGHSLSGSYRFRLLQEFLHQA